MRYPGRESMDERKNNRIVTGETEAKLYAETESYSEFSFKRSALGIAAPRLFFLDRFRMHYFYSNGHEWLYHNDWMLPLCTILSGVTMFVTSVPLIAVPESRLFSASVFVVAVVGLICSAVYFLSRRAVADAKKLLHRVNFGYQGV